MKKRKNYIIYICLIVLILICIILSLFYRTEDVVNTEKAFLYKNIGINSNELNILYLNVGQADSTLITMGENVMLIDAGNKSDGLYIVEFLKAQGIEKIDYLVETHSDDDHSGGIEKVVQNLEVSNVYMPQSAIQKSEIKDNIDINVFSNLEKIDVLKVGHHGSDSSTSQNFLNVVLPTYSIISVCNSEYSKHPANATIERLKAINSKIYRTDEVGTIWITSNGSNIEIQELDINLNGANRSAKLVENRKYSLFFYCNILPSLSTIV